MKIIDADALIDELTQRCCKNCVKRMGMKNGKRKMVYEIGDAPCLACEVNDIKVELDDAPTIDAEPVVHCKDCKYYTLHCVWNGEKRYWCELDILHDGENGFCSQGKKTVFAQIITGLKEAIEYEKENGTKMDEVEE